MEMPYAKIYVKVTPKTGYAIVQESFEYPSYTRDDQFEVKNINNVFEFDYLDSEVYNLDKIEVNGVVVDAEDYEEGLTLESGKVYKIKYYLSHNEE